MEDEFLAELEVGTFVPPPAPKILEKQRKQQERELKRLAKEQEKAQKAAEREAKRALKQQTPKPAAPVKEDDAGSIFDEEGTPIVGRDKLVLLKKVKQYKTLFPDELKAFKIKRNPSVEDLEGALSEMAVIVEVGGVDQFLLDSVLQCIRIVEGVSSNYEKYDIRGCADLLKANKQFHSLCKQLFIKYNVFSAVPVEYQLVLLVSTTAYMCNQKNRHKGELNTYLDESVAVPDKA